MMGSPSPLPAPAPPPPPLPSFGLGGSGTTGDEEQQPQRGEDYDLLSGWARALSVSPRLYPTSYGGSSTSSLSMSLGLDSNHYGAGSSYRGIGGDSPLLGPTRRESQLSVGNGLSPVLGPTHMGGSSSTSVNGGGGGSLMASGQGGGYDFSSLYHASPPSDALVNHHHSPHAHVPVRSHSLTSQSPAITHSFSNVDKLPSMSPQALPPPLHSPPAPLATTSAPVVNPTFVTSNSTDLTTIDPQSTGTTMASTVNGAGEPEEEDPRIRAYAKLEFPTFDIYIQKLSVIIGRRPAAAAAAAAVAARSPSLPSAALAGAPATNGGSAPSPTPLNDARGDNVKLEDFVMGMEEDPKPTPPPPAPPVKEIIKEEESEPTMILAPPMVPQLSLTPSSPPGGREEAQLQADTTFAEFLKSSPPSATPPVVSTSEAAIPPLVLPPTSTSAPPPPTTIAPSPIPEASPVPQLPTHMVPSPVPTPAPAPPAIFTDIDLGPIRAVSRQHARLYFDFDLAGWAVEVLGRNGVVVEGNWKAKGERQALSSRTKIQIAERIFYFVLPTIDPPAQVAAPTTMTEAELLDEGSLSELSDLESGSALEELSDSDDDSDDDDDESNADPNGDESSSLSELSESDIELSPIQNPHNLLGAIPHLRLSDGFSPLASTSMLPPLPPLPRISQKSVGGMAGKRIEVLQAARSGGKGMGSGGKGKGASMRGGGKGKMLPPSRPRASSFSEDSLDEDGYEYEYDGEEEEMAIDYDNDKGDGDFSLHRKRANTVAAAGGSTSTRLAYNPTSTGELSYASSSMLPPLPPLPPSMTGGKNKSAGKTAGQMANKKRKADLNKIVIKRSNGDNKTGGAKKQPKKSGVAALPSFPGYPGGAMEQPHPGQPPIKRGRGRPPKNGICAQRPSKKKLEAYAAATAAGKSPGTIAATLGPSPVLSMVGLPPIPPPLPPSMPLPPPPPVAVPPPLPPSTSGAPPTAPPKPKTKTKSTKTPKTATSTTGGKAPAKAPAPTPSAGKAPKATKKPKANKIPQSAIVASTSNDIQVNGSNVNPDITPYTLPIPQPPQPDPNSNASATNVVPLFSADGQPLPPPVIVKPPRPPAYTPGTWPADLPLPREAPEQDLFIKPPFTYASLIAQAVDDSEQQKVTLHGLYEWVIRKWPYFRENQNGWQNSIRHNLTIARGFLKVPRTADEPGKGSFWTIDPAQRANFDGFHFRKKNNASPAPLPVSVPRPIVVTPAPPPPPPPAPMPTPSVAPIQPAPSPSPVPVSHSQPIAPRPAPQIVAPTSTPGPIHVTKPPPQPQPIAASPAPQPTPPPPRPVAPAPAPPKPIATKATPAPAPSPTKKAAVPAPVAQPPTNNTSAAARASPATTTAAAAAPAPAPAASASPSLSAPLPIIVAPIPDSYVRPAPPPNNGTPPDDLTAALLKDPPIVLHEGKLILNPAIFAHLTKDQLNNLQVLPASNALQILQAYVVQHFTERFKKIASEKAAAAAAAKAKAAAAAGGGGGTASTSATPATNGAKAGPGPKTTAKAANESNKRKLDESTGPTPPTKTTAPRAAKLAKVDNKK